MLQSMQYEEDVARDALEDQEVLELASLENLSASRGLCVDSLAVLQPHVTATGRLYATGRAATALVARAVQASGCPWMCEHMVVVCYYCWLDALVYRDRRLLLVSQGFELRHVHRVSEYAPR